MSATDRRQHEKVDDRSRQTQGMFSRCSVFSFPILSLRLPFQLSAMLFSLRYLTYMCVWCFCVSKPAVVTVSIVRSARPSCAAMEPWPRDECEALIMRHLRLRDLRQKLLSILNYMRSVQRRLTIDVRFHAAGRCRNSICLTCVCVRVYACVVCVCVFVCVLETACSGLGLRCRTNRDRRRRRLQWPQLHAASKRTC